MFCSKLLGEESRINFSGCRILSQTNGDEVSYFIDLCQNWQNHWRTEYYYAVLRPLTFN